MKRDATSRFSDRAGDYARYRPAYPGEALDALTEALGGPATIADLGAGTGIFAAQLLAHGHTVYGVEPNAPMRRAMEDALAGQRRFRPVDGHAEATTLPAQRVDAVTAAQAFHWFDVDATRAECLRILRPGGKVFLLWNERLTEGAFLEGYEAILQAFSDDYAQVDHRNVTEERIARFYGGRHYTLHNFPNAQALDWDGVEGRTRSCSYVPAPDHPRYAPMIAAMRDLFGAHAVEGRVTFRYTTQCYAGVVRA